MSCEFKSHLKHHYYVSVAQLDRALDYEPKGWRFKSSLALHIQTCPVAQLAEQLTFNQWVKGSNPFGDTKMEQYSNGKEGSLLRS